MTAHVLVPKRSTYQSVHLIANDELRKRLERDLRAVNWNGRMNSFFDVTWYLINGESGVQVGNGYDPRTVAPIKTSVDIPFETVSVSAEYRGDLHETLHAARAAREAYGRVLANAQKAAEAYRANAILFRARSEEAIRNHVSTFTIRPDIGLYLVGEPIKPTLRETKRPQLYGRR